MTLTIRRKIILGFGGSLLALFLISCLSYVSITRLEDSTRWVRHSMTVIDGTQRIVLDLRKALVQYRAYLLTKDPEDLKRFQAGAGIALEDLAEVKSLVSNDAGQIQNLGRVEVLVRQRLADSQIGIDLCAQGRFKKAFDLSNNLDNLKLTQKIDESIRLMVDL